MTRIRALLGRLLPQGAILLSILTFAAYFAGLLRDLKSRPGKDIYCDGGAQLVDTLMQHDLIDRYNKPVNVVEYSNFKREVHEIVFGLPNDMGKGTAIWEPLGWRSGMFDREGNVTDLIEVYDDMNARYIQESKQ